MADAVLPRPAGRPADFLLLAVGIGITVLTGFWFTYFGPILDGSYQNASSLVHLHGWSFFGWYALFIVQATLVRSRNVRLHRTLGGWSVALAAVMVVTGMIVVGVQMRDALAATEPGFWIEAGPAVWSTLVLFAGFYVAALLRRRDTPMHKRLMVVASAAGMGAATFRIILVTLGPSAWLMPVAITVTNLFIVAGMAFDLYRERKAHRAWLIGLPICLVVELLVFYATPTPVGQLLARGLAWVGTTFGSLY
jgi:uncharacterized membrane protein YozB (DUF420 family)